MDTGAVSDTELMNCCLSEGDDLNQEGVLPVILREVSSRVRKIEWLMVSKAAVKA